MTSTKRDASGSKHFPNRLTGSNWPNSTFQLRGPGDLFGTQQHGLPPLRIANLQRDRDLLEEARKEAQALVASDPGLKHPDHAKLRRQMLLRYGKALDLGDVG